MGEEYRTAGAWPRHLPSITSALLLHILQLSLLLPSPSLKKLERCSGQGPGRQSCTVHHALRAAAHLQEGIVAPIQVCEDAVLVLKTAPVRPLPGLGLGSCLLRWCSGIATLQAAATMVPTAKQAAWGRILLTATSPGQHALQQAASTAGATTW